MTMISVVVPVYQCAGCIIELNERIKNTLSKITTNFEVILVDDRSPDNVWNVLVDLAKNDCSVKAVRLSRNFGQHAAIAAGLAESRGDWTVVMDCDLQDPPEEIIKLYETAQDGFDIVFGRRVEKKHSFLKRKSSELYFKFMRLASGYQFDSSLGSFSILSRKVVDSYLKFKEKEHHYLFILYWLGFNTGYVNYVHDHRHRGKSSYSLKRLIKHAISGLLFQTTTLLKWIIYLGFSISSVGILSAFYLMYRYFFHSAYPGWTSLAVLILIVSGVIISSLGVIGLYIGGIFEQVKNRPLYVVDEICSANEKQGVLL